MKAINKSIVIMISFLFLTMFVNNQAQEVKTAGVKTEFKALGNCGMCKSRIEKALKAEGVESAVWDKDTKIATVVFDASIISEEQLHKNVAEAGHDTEKFRAPEEVYSKLPGCCKYERSSEPLEEKKKEESGHKH